MHYIALDTSIYRQLGINFHEKVDYVNIIHSLFYSGNVLILIDTVEKEINDYFRNDVIAPLITEYERIYFKFYNNEYLENISLPNLTLNEQNARKKFSANIRKDIKKVIRIKSIPTNELISFCLQNKREERKDNTRDFIIYYTLLQFAKKNKKDKIIFITNDNIFYQNNYFKNKLVKEKVSNLFFLESIPSFLSQYGYKVDYLNNSIVINSIKVSSIKRILIKESYCLPSYICEFYYDNENLPELIELKVLNMKLYEYYTYRDEKDRLILTTSLKVRVYAIYKPEESKDLRNIQIEKYYIDNKNRIDEYNRPIYENDILFIYESFIDEQNKLIKKQRFIDFIVDYNLKQN